MQISSKEKWWRLEFWRRLTGCDWNDIQMRMAPEVGNRTVESDKKKRNSLNMAGSRTFYAHYRMISWHPTNDAKGSCRQELLGQLGDWHKANNSTRGLTPGWVDETLGEVQGNRVVVPTASERCGQRLQGGRRE